MSVSDKSNIVLTDCLSVPKAMGIGPIIIMPAPLVFCCPFVAGERSSKSSAAVRIRNPASISVIPSV